MKPKSGAAGKKKTAGGSESSSKDEKGLEGVVFKVSFSPDALHNT